MSEDANPEGEAILDDVEEAADALEEAVEELQEAEETMIEADTEEEFSEAIEEVVEAEAVVQDAASMLTIEAMRAASYDGTLAALHDAGLTESPPIGEIVEETEETVSDTAEDVSDTVEETVADDDGADIAPDPVHPWYRRIGR